MGNDELKVLGFRYELELIDKATGEVVDREVRYNRIPQAGIDFLIQAPFGDVPTVGTFHCFLFKNNFVASAGTTAADIPSAMGEFVDYSEATRPVWGRAYNGAGTLDNSGAKAVFTPTVDAVVYGAGIVSNSAKGSNTGLLLSVVRFSTTKQLTAGLESKLTCGLTYIPTNAV